MFMTIYEEEQMLDSIAQEVFGVSDISHVWYVQAAILRARDELQRIENTSEIEDVPKDIRSALNHVNWRDEYHWFATALDLVNVHRQNDRPTRDRIPSVLGEELLRIRHAFEMGGYA